MERVRVSDRWMHAAAAALLTITCVLALCMATGCAKTSEDVLREAVNAEFDPYKNLEDEALETIASIAEEEGLAELGISGSEFASSVLEDFDYRIDGVDIKGAHAVVRVSVISKSASDFDAKIASRVQSFVESDASQKLTPEERAKRIGDIALGSIQDADVITEHAEIEFTLQDTTWVSTNAADVLSKMDILAYRN